MPGTQSTAKPVPSLPSYLFQFLFEGLPLLPHRFASTGFEVPGHSKTAELFPSGCLLFHGVPHDTHFIFSIEYLILFCLLN